ncbi:Catenin-beta-like protein [Coprinopsis sp. MPI-PUGE-AT-0042]|nr:Catenin-beta-like protein [Coprinopsis sp. MPI-PUGE-AT-0042]
MNIDDIFKTSRFASSSNKRKLPDNPTPELLKKLRVDEPAGDVEMAPPPPPQKAPSRRATVEDAEDEDNPDQGEFAPGGDADYFVEEDDEGRFFGGGLSSEQKEILNIFDNAGNAPEPEDGLTLPAIRRSLVRLERAVNKNQDQRSKYPDDPSKFIDSEADLDAAIKALLPLAQVPDLAYRELVRSGSIALLVGLFTHENVDIVIDVVEVLSELTDDDVTGEADEEAEDALKELIEALVDLSALELLVENLPRLNEAEESDRQGVFHILGVFENILGFNPDLGTTLVEKTKLMPWLLDRVQAKTHDENRGYSAELLSILLQSSTPNRLAFGKADGVEVVLKLVSQYRRKDPSDADETEYMENLFDALCSALTEPSIKKQFLEAEGPDLMILMMKEKLHAKSRSIKALDHAMSGPQGVEVCNAFVDALGLKTLFSAIMGKVSKKGKGTTTLPDSEDVNHILGIISSLFSNLESDSTHRIRLLAKFVENDYEKVDKLLDVRESARTRLQLTDKEIAKEREEMDEDEDILADEDVLYLRRLDGGLFTLQMVDYILAWIVMEDDGIQGHVVRMLNRKNQSLENIVATLRVYHENMDEVPPAAEDDPSGYLPSQKEILENLITALGTPSSAN